MATARFFFAALLLVMFCYVQECNSNKNSCSRIIKMQIQQKLGEFMGTGRERIELGISIWKDFFKVFPTAREYFKRINGHNIYSPQFKAHTGRIMADLFLNLKLLDEPKVLHVHQLHRAELHRTLNVPNEYLGTFVGIMMKKMVARFPGCFDVDDWEHCGMELGARLMTGISVRDLASV